MPPEGRIGSLGDWLDRQAKKAAEAVRKTLYGAVISAGGLLIRDDGAFEITTADGTYTLYAKRGSDGKREFGLLRDNGTFVLRTFSTAGGQAWALHDNTNNITNSDDGVSGQGIGRPYIPYPSAHTDWAVMPKTTSTSFVTLDEVRYYKQHPKTNMTLRIGAQVGSTGEWRVLQDGIVKASGGIADGVLTIATASFANDGTHLAPLNLDVQARVASGPGPVSAWIRHSGGVQS